MGIKISIVKNFSSAHFLIGHEKCGRIHGHNWKVKVEVEGELEERGWVIDFTLLKNIADELLNKFDHKMLLPDSINYDDDRKNLNFTANSKKYSFPKEDCVIVPIGNVTCENMSYFLHKELWEILKKFKNIHGLEIKVNERDEQGAAFKNP
ncbi:MAG: 6-pyruvoyl tetrahydropterin synthase [Candidatus Altarchaeum sp. CG12_big_fil_rev_8_21_14_0_65_33_22]|nr:MAG: 6-pyruvoyl tetrahydropterin synthase [Candidatus Altarchaeum sp. CG12_big_fil_rev_8_21_14_0_65_33_22]PIV27014.1 MAG: 6-pyruvoyl tetrahydropterin synthase [Candidatus Altarchaeum sp. CG03_land_8_20_14_0_80_32_618]